MELIKPPLRFARRKISREEYKKRVKFTDDFFFSRIMQDEMICKDFIEDLLGMKIMDIKFHTTQRFFKREKHTHGIRVDVLLEEPRKMIVVEMQTTNYLLPLRARFYQGIIDTATLPKGASYKALKETYIIFICTFDPFGLGLPIYNVKQVFEAAPEVQYNDGSHKIFYNAVAFERCENERQKAILKYVATEKATSDITRKIDKRIIDEQTTQKMRSDFMTFEVRLAERYDEGATEKAILIARNFIAMGVLTDEQIAQGTGLSVEEVKNLR